MNAQINAGTDFPPAKILMVDDRPENLFALEAALKCPEYELVKALSGAEALQLVRQHDFSVILLDVQMPMMDGLETAERIRLEKRSEATPIIFVTAIHRTEEFVERGYSIGAVDYLFKPLNIDVLKAKVSAFAFITWKNWEAQRQRELLKEAAFRDHENAILKENLRAKDEFLSMAAHELKTPITPLNLQNQAFIEMFKDGSMKDMPSEYAIRLLQTSQEQIDRLLRLIDDLLDVSRMNVGKLEIQREDTDLGALTERTLAAFADGATKAGCNLRFEIQKNVRGSWDRFRVEQVLVNLITNAIKYGAGKPIEVAVRSEPGKALISVRDYGIGIAPKDQNRIFERFERAVSPRHYGGLGLGLYIVKEIVLLHRGHIFVDSALYEGAKFTVELPSEPNLEPVS